MCTYAAQRMSPAGRKVTANCAGGNWARIAERLCSSRAQFGVMVIII